MRRKRAPATVANPGRTRRARQARPASRPPRPASVLEVRVFPGTIEINEYYSEGQAQALADALAGLGLRTKRRFASRCG